jgi:hypothetical protein
MKLLLTTILIAMSISAFATAESTTATAAPVGTKKANTFKTSKASQALNAAKVGAVTSKTVNTPIAPAAAATSAPSKLTPVSAQSTTAHSSSFHFEENKSELFLSATQAEFNTSNGFSNLEISGMYAYLIQDQIQAGAAIALGSTSNGHGGSYTSTDIYALGIYNFQPTINEAVFAFAGLGIASMPNGYSSSSTKLGIKLGAGKRFPLWAKIQYVPTASIEKIGDFDPIIRIVPVNFSLIF